VNEAVTEPGGAELAAEEDLERHLRAVRQALDDCEATDAAALLDEVPVAGPPTAVFVGEPGAGKSSLISALLGEPQLLPTDAVAGTGAYCVLRQGPAPAGRAHLPGGDTVEAAGAAAVRDLLRHYGRADAEPVPTWLEAELPEPRLAGLQLVDTPGVGGLDGTLGELTLRSLQLAQVLVFVTDCSAPLGQAELEFLRQAGARVERVIFVLTKIDRSTGWRKIAAEDAELLAEQVPRFAGSSMRPVSAKWAQDALAQSNPRLRERLAADSGVDALWDELRAITAVRALQVANRLRAARSALDLAHQQRSAARARLADAGAAADEVAALREQVAACTSRSEDWYLDLDLLSRGLRRSTTAYLRRRGEALLAALDMDLRPKKPDQDAAARRLITGLAQLQQETVELLRARLEGICEEIGAGLTVQEDLSERLAEMVGEPLEVPVAPRSRDTRRNRAQAMTQTQTTYMGTMMAHTAVTALGTLAAALTVSNPVGWALAGSFGAFWTYRAIRARRAAGDEAALREWAAKAVQTAIGDVDLECSGRIDAALHLLSKTMRSAFPQELARLQAELAECQRAAAASEAERAAALQRADYQLAKLRALAAKADQRLARLALPPSPPRSA
jgi:hypothetical protein